MEDAKRLRAQAERCLQIARLLSDRAAAAELHINAAKYLARAIELEGPSALTTKP
jgi:hypothetical protein